MTYLVRLGRQPRCKIICKVLRVTAAGLQTQAAAKNTAGEDTRNLWGR